MSCLPSLYNHTGGTNTDSDTTADRASAGQTQSRVSPSLFV